MPMFRNSMEQYNNAMSMAIPLLMRKKEHEAELKLKGKKIELEKMKLQEEATEKEAELKRNADALREKLAVDMYKESVKSGNKDMAQQFGQQVEGLGYPVAKRDVAGPVMPGQPPLSEYLVGKKKQGMTEAELTERSLGGDPSAKAILEAMNKRKTRTAKAGKTDITNVMGSIPPGYTVEYDDKGRPAAMRKIPGGPATEKITPKEKKASAQKQVSNILAEMGTQYDKLSEEGAISDVDKSAAENISTRIGTSDLGQAIGKAVGSKNQSTRNQILQMRPLLLNYIRQASEMGARGLDSEKELEFYLQAATNPKLDIQTNLSALRVLDDAYGLGSKSKPTDLDTKADELIKKYGKSKK